jgi:Fur family iron response transcriptional regulator
MFKAQHDTQLMAPNGVTIQIRSILERYGLRATRQRLGLAKLLFGQGDRHVTADALAAEARAARMSASLATVYNVLNLFAQVGLVRGLAIEGTKTVFDTNTSDHCHFFFEDTADVSDIAAEGIKIVGDVEPPDGYEVSKIDIVVRLRPKGSCALPIKDFDELEDSGDSL